MVLNSDKTIYWAKTSDPNSNSPLPFNAFSALSDPHLTMETFFPVAAIAAAAWILVCGHSEKGV